MEYASFYGGRRGTPFVIVKSYPDIPTMTECFGQGDDYKQVNYDEYVIINAYKRDHPDNGKIFRRGYDIYSGRTIICTEAKESSTGQVKTNQSKAWYLSRTTEYVLNTSHDAKGAKYVGKVQGPPGIAPILKLLTYAGAVKQYDYQYEEDRKSSGSFSVAKGDLVSGKTNNEIRWVVANISEENSDLDKAYAYVGFKIPYPVVEFSAVKVTQYDENGVYTTKVPQPTFTGDLNKRPFYHPWELYIPKGIKGDCLKNYRVVAPSAGMQIYDLNYYLQTGLKRQYEGFDNDKDYSYVDTNGVKHRGKQILVYDEIIYDTYQSGELTCFYVADYNTLTSMDIAQDGTVSIFSTHSEPLIYPKLMKWITDITLNKSADGTEDIPGHFVIHYNNDSYNKTDTSEYDLDWVNNLVLESDGQVRQEFTGGRATEYITDKNPDRVPEQGTDLRIKWINNVEINDDGTVIITFNDKDQNDQIHTSVFPRRIKWLKSFDIDGPTGILTYQFNTDQDAIVKPLAYPVDMFLKQDKDQSSSAALETMNEGTGDQSIYAVYPTLSEPKKISPPINYILATDITPDKHLIVLYADAAKRQVFIDNANNPAYVGKEKAYQFFPVGVVDDPVYYNLYRSDKYGVWDETIEGETVQTHLYEGWLDLGVSSIASGILVGADIPIQTIEKYATDHNLSIETADEKVDAAIAYLNETYPAGLGKEPGTPPYTSPIRSDVTTSDPLLMEKIVTTGDLNEGAKYFLGFDYQIVVDDPDAETLTYSFKGWYLIGSLSQVPIVVSDESEEATALEALPEGGMWFIIGDAYSVYDQDYVDSLITNNTESGGNVQP